MLDLILHPQLKLAIVSLLISTEVAEFTYIQEQTGVKYHGWRYYGKESD